MTAQHTPTPWVALDTGAGWEVTRDRCNSFVADCIDEAESQANAELIVLAVNAHEAMREALERLERAVPLSVFEEIRHRDSKRYFELADALDAARSAIKLAGGGA